MADRTLILKLNEDGLSRVEIARRLGTSHQTVSRHILSAEEGFDSVGEWENHRARQKGYESRYSYILDLLKQRGFNSGHNYTKDRVRRRGFESYSDYRDWLAQQKGFESYSSQNQLRYAQSRGFSSLAEYEIYLAEKREQAKKLSGLIIKRLEEMGKNQSWLAEQIGVTKQAVSLHIKKRSLPKPELLEKMLLALGIESINH